MADVPARSLLAVVVVVVGLSSAAAGQPAASLPPPAVAVSFDEAVRTAIAANPTVERASAAVSTAEALLAQARAGVRPTVDGTVVTTVLDDERGFSGNVVQPQVQTLFGGAVASPVLAMAQWAARAQAAQRVGVSRLAVDDVRRQVGVAAAEAYLAIVGATRQLEVNQRARDTARAQFEYARARREGGVGSRLNELRAAQELAVNEELVERAGLAVSLAREALGLLMSADGPVEIAGEPAFETPPVDGETWLLDRTDIRLFDARIDLANRVVADSWRDWVPTVRASFEPQYITPSGLFQPSGTWRALLSASIPIFDGGQRRAVKDVREADLELARVERREGELRARSAMRAARASIDAEVRALQRAQEASAQAAEVLKITDIAFRAGATTNIELVDAQRRSRDAETAVRQAEDRARLARLALLVALGRFPK
jgi:outer membrane protein TolC